MAPEAADEKLETLREVQATLLYPSRPDLDIDRCIREWVGWDYDCRVERQHERSIDVFKGGAFVLLRLEEGAQDLSWEDLEQQAELCAGMADTFDHVAALSAARSCGHRLLVIVRVLADDPSIALNELFITLNGLVAATDAKAVWLAHARALFTAENFIDESEWMRPGPGACNPYGLYVSVQLRLPLERCSCVVGFTRGLSHFGWPEFEVEDPVSAPPAATLYRTLVNAALHQIRSKGRMGVGDHVLTSTGGWKVGERDRSRNFEGEVYRLVGPG